MKNGQGKRKNPAVQGQQPVQGRPVCERERREMCIRDRPRELREKITPYRPLYDMGLHGPDLMFYYRALQSNPVNRLGNAMHEQPGQMCIRDSIWISAPAALPKS